MGNRLQEIQIISVARFKNFSQIVKILGLNTILAISTLFTL
jgi:hypothetical protein